MSSELEHVVLGVVAVEQPCTAYHVRRIFQRSPSRHWSGSAGAIYPLVRRLEARGLLKAAARKGDGRAARLVRVTPKGRRTLTAWLRPPLPDAAGLMTLDPLRVRVGFLGVLSADDRRAFVAEAEDKLTDQLKRLARYTVVPGKGALYDHLIHRGAVHAVRAQLRLLADVRRALDD